MEVPERLKVLSEQIQEVCKAEQFYVVDIDEQPTDDVVGTVVFGMRNAGVLAPLPPTAHGPIEWVR